MLNLHTATARRATLACLLTLLLAAGCGTPTPSSPAGRYAGELESGYAGTTKDSVYTVTMTLLPDGTGEVLALQDDDMADTSPIAWAVTNERVRVSTEGGDTWFLAWEDGELVPESADGEPVKGLSLELIEAIAVPEPEPPVETEPDVTDAPEPEPAKQVESAPADDSEAQLVP